MSDATFFAPHDDAADASRLLARIGSVALAIGVPAAAGLGAGAVEIVFAIGVGLLASAQALDPPGGFFGRFKSMRGSIATAAWVAVFVWATISLLWTPFPGLGLRRLATLVAIALPTGFVVLAGRPHTRAADLYLFPIGVVVAVAVALAIAAAGLQGWTVDEDASTNLSLAVVVMVFPAMAACAARGRNGLARALVILALVFTRIAGPPANSAALLAGFAAFSFALSDARRTARELGRLAALLALAAPLAPILAPLFVRPIAHVDLASLPPPGPSLAAAADVIWREPLRLVTGHGVEAAVRALKGGVLPPDAPRSLIFEIWYDLGLVGAAVAAFALWRSFEAINEASPRMQPYFTATLVTIVTLAFTSTGWMNVPWMILSALAIIAADRAARGQYRTLRPSASGLAHF